MSGSKFIDSIELPIVDTETPPSPNYRKILVRNNGMFWKDPDGTEHKVAEEIPSGAENPVFIQDTQPTVTNKFIWIQTNVGGDPSSFSMWFEDGVQ